MKKRPVIDRLIDKIVRLPFSGCWIWMGTTAKGYGLIGNGYTPNGNSKMVYTHRVSFQHFVGEIPPGKEICHTCDVPSCCNPAHLFAGTHKENIADMMSKQRGDAHRRGTSTQCQRGHELTGDNLRVRPDGRRYCHQCKMESQRARRIA
jgi:hypothetical protein